MNKINLTLENTKINDFYTQVNSMFNSSDFIIMSITELSGYIGLSKSSIYSLVKKNKIPFHKPTGVKNCKLFFIQSEIDLWVKSR